MKIFDKFEIVEPYPALYFQEEDVVIVSDLHLGLESLMASSGVYFPKFQLDEMKEEFENIIEKVEPEKIVINGDLKHEFSETTWEEREEVQDLLEFLTEKVEEVLILKGNHDNYLIYAVKDFDNVKLEEKVVLDNATFLHGDEEIDLKNLNTEYLIIGHEHPALALKDDLGIKEKVRCFLYGELVSKKIIVLPAMSKFAEGSQVNQIPKKRLLTPLLRETGVDHLKAIAVSEEAGIFEFPEVGKI